MLSTKENKSFPVVLSGLWDSLVQLSTKCLLLCQTHLRHKGHSSDHNRQTCLLPVWNSVTVEQVRYAVDQMVMSAMKKSKTEVGTDKAWKMEVSAVGNSSFRKGPTEKITFEHRPKKGKGVTEAQWRF